MHPRTILALLAALALGAALATRASAREASVWDGMAEGAALKLGTAARQLGRTAESIAGDGRIGRLSVLRSDAEELVRRADALARMAREPLPDDPQ
jgi:cobalamin biosynthesis protein CobD/CbiB